MQWEFMVALALAIPFFAFPVLLWYLDIGSSYAAIQEARKRRFAPREGRVQGSG